MCASGLVIFEGKAILDRFLDLLQKKIFVFDGATGTHIQNQNLSVDDYGGEHTYGCNEYLVVSKPSAVEKVHSDYLSAGCDVIETNTFGANSIVLAEYGMQDRVYELNFTAAQIAKKIAHDFSTPAHPRFVAGSIGPGTKLPSLGHISFKELASAYEEQARGLIDGGVDLLCIETCQDILQVKAALYGIRCYLKNLRKNIPIIVSVTIETTGTMLVGTDMLTVLATLDPFDVDAIGLNCATGPQEMSEHVRTLAAYSSKPIFVMPNAGMPENVGGKAHYHLSPEDFSRTLTSYIKELGVQIVGGCCGTTPEHIRQLVASVGSLSPSPRTFTHVPSISSLYQSVPFRIENPPLLIGERTNANGSKLFRELLLKEDWEGMVAVGRAQEKEGAHALDVCVAYVGRNESEDMRQLISRMNQQITIPLMIDSTEPSVIEVALQHISGKAIINSVNLEDGEKKLATIIGLCKDYGAAVVALTIDEEGMAKTAERKVAVAHRLYDLIVGKYGMKPYDVIFDMLTFTIGSGDEEFRKSALETLEAIRIIKKELPECQTSLGISNVSFGLAPSVRQVLNSVFLHYAIEVGLDMAIVHAAKILPLYKIDERGRELARKLIFDEREWEGEGAERKLVFDPLKELIAYYADKTEQKLKQPEQLGATAEERLKQRIIEGNSVGIQDDLDEALKSHSAVEIINTILLEGMKVVGELFGSGQMQLPFVLQSAEVMKMAVTSLEPYMEKNATTQKGTMALATVKGDVHDIGKNLVDIILTNNGYKVYNLGIKCPIEKMIESAAEHRADAIGMSGLLVKSTQVMKENLEILNERNVTIPVILGGAALTRRFVENELQPIYKGQVFYANDAFDGLHLMEKIVNGNGKDESNSREREEILTGAEAKITPLIKQQEVSDEQNAGTSTIEPAENIPAPPFWGSKVVAEIPLDEVYPYINEVALFRGQWRAVRGAMTEEEYNRIIDEEIKPKFERLKTFSKERQLLQPKVVYGYFPCQSDGNDLIVYDAPSDFISPDKLRREHLKEAVRFTFPRQKSGRRLCISDFFASVESGRIDVVAVHLVTMGKQASEYARTLYETNRYQEYLYFHGLSVEATEALAEYWHKRIRRELNLHHRDASDVKKLFSQGYQGARYSFGYAACPDLEDHAKLFALLHPERIGVTLTEEFMLDPEQSTDALIVHHPSARYFNI